MDTYPLHELGIFFALGRSLSILTGYGSYEIHVFQTRRLASTIMKTCLGFVVVPRMSPYGRRLGMKDILQGEIQEAVGEVAVKSIAVLGSGILVFGAGLTLVNLVLTLINAFFQREIFTQVMPFDRRVGGGTATVTRTRLQLAQLLALGLEILVISDLVETLVRSTTAYTYESLAKLALVAGIRTFLSFFLGLETKEIIDRANEDKRLDGIAVLPQKTEDDN